MEPENARMKILDLLEKGTISGSEAGNLLEAMHSPQAESQAAVADKIPEKTGKAHWIQVRVTQLSTGKRKVSLRVPIWFIRIGIAFSKRHADNDEERSSLQIGREFFRDPVKGKIVDTSDPEDDEHVEVTFL